MKGVRVVVSLCLLITACAQVREIDGGDKDTVGPQLVASTPANYSTNFQGDRILLRFDERVQLERLREGLPVSPPLATKPELRVLRGRDVELTLKAPLRANTTYTFSIGEAVKDLTEGNKAAGTDLVLSTGPVLDSLLVEGRITRANNGSAEADMLVLLYDASDTAYLRNGPPLYATRTDAQGHFRLRHLRAGTMRMAALRDLNGNYRYDLPNEEIAFASGTISPHAPADTVAEDVLLRSFIETSPTQAVREAMVTPDRAWQLVLARPAKNIEVRDLAREGGRLIWEQEWGAKRDTVLLWPSDTTALTEGRYEISTEEGALDTLRYRPIQPMPFNLNMGMRTLEMEGGAVVRMEAARPIAAVDRDRILLLRDSVPVAFELSMDSSHTRRFQLVPQLAPGENAQLMLLPKAVRDRYDTWNDTLRFTIGRAAERSMGTLRVNVKSEQTIEGSLLLELLDAQGKVVRGPLPLIDGQVMLERLTPGTFNLRVIEDRNANGHWDTGVVNSQLQPERTWKHPDPVNVRAAWDLGVDWTIDGR